MLLIARFRARKKAQESVTREDLALTIRELNRRVEALKSSFCYLADKIEEVRQAMDEVSISDQDSKEFDTMKGHIEEDKDYV